jgi:hypothetical protein
MSNTDISGFGRGTYGQGAWNTELPVLVTGVVGTSALGSETVVSENIFAVTGVAGTSALGSETVAIKVDAAVTGVSATGVIGNILIWSDIDVSQTPNWTKIAA